MNQQDDVLFKKLWSPEAESASLASVLIDPDQVAHLPVEDAFGHYRRRLLARALHQLAANGSPIDFISVLDTVEMMDKSDKEIGLVPETGKEEPWAAYIASLMGSQATGVYADHYAGIVNRRYQLRKAWAMVGKAAEKFVEDDSDPDEFLRWFRDEADAALSKMPVGDVGVTTTEANYQAMEDYEKRKQMRLDGIPLGWSMPIAELNRFVDYVPPNAVVLIYADGGVGKTILAEQIHDHWQILGHRGVFYENELSLEAMGTRRLSRLSRVPAKKIERGIADAAEENRISQSVAAAEEWPGKGWYVPVHGWDVYRLCADIERRAKRDEIQYVVVDHLKFLAQNHPVRGGTNETAVFAEVFGKLTSVTKALGLRLVVVHHSNKENKYYSSSNIQNFSNVIIQLAYRLATSTEYYPDTKYVTARVNEISWWRDFYIEKATFGKRGHGMIMLEGAIVRFHPTARAQYINDDDDDERGDE